MFFTRKKGILWTVHWKGSLGNPECFFLWHHCKKTLLKTLFLSVGRHLFFKVMVVADLSGLCAFPIWDGTENIEQFSPDCFYSGAKRINSTSSFGFRQLLAWRQLSHLYDVTSHSMASTRGEVIKENRVGTHVRVLPGAPLSPVPYPRLLDTDSLV